MKVYDAVSKRTLRRSGRKRPMNFHNTSDDPIHIESTVKKKSRKLILQPDEEELDDDFESPKKQNMKGKSVIGGDQRSYEDVKRSDNIFKGVAECSSNTSKSKKQRKTINDEPKSQRKLKAKEKPKTSDGTAVREGGKKRRGRIPKEGVKINNRCTPHQLTLVVRRLKETQKKVVREMGFGCLLTISIEAIPGRLGRFVVDSFNDRDMTFYVDDVSVKIDEDVIHKVIGLPNSGIDLSSLEVKAQLDPEIKKWRQRYGDPKVQISSTEMREMILNSNGDCGFFFQLDFIMLFLTSMVNCYKNGKCLEQVLNVFSDDMDFKNINWCRYVSNVLKICKQKWSSTNIRSPFTGPLAILTIIFADSVKCRGINVDRSVTAVEFWTRDRLTERERIEIFNERYIKDSEDCEGETSNKKQRLKMLTRPEDTSSKGKGVLVDVEKSQNTKMVKSILKETKYAERAKKNKGLDIAELLVELSKLVQLFESIVESKERFENRFGDICSKHPTNPQVLCMKREYEEMLNARPCWLEQGSPVNDTVGLGIIQSPLDSNSVEKHGNVNPNKDVPIVDKQKSNDAGMEKNEENVGNNQDALMTDGKNVSREVESERKIEGYKNKTGLMNVKGDASSKGEKKTVIENTSNQLSAGVVNVEHKFGTVASNIVKDVSVVDDQLCTQQKITRLNESSSGEEEVDTSVTDNESTEDEHVDSGKHGAGEFEKINDLIKDVCDEAIEGIKPQGASQTTGMGKIVIGNPGEDGKGPRIWKLTGRSGMVEITKQKRLPKSEVKGKMLSTGSGKEETFMGEGLLTVSKGQKQSNDMVGVVTENPKELNTNKDLEKQPGTRVSENKKTEIEKPTTGTSEGFPSFSLGLTQEEVKDKVETKNVERGSTSEPVNDLSHLTKTQTGEKVVPEISNTGYMVREVEIVKKFTRMEERLWNCIFPDEGSAVKTISLKESLRELKIAEGLTWDDRYDREPVYENPRGVVCDLVEMQTLQEGMEVLNQVVDTWAEVLNFYEEFRTDEHSRRLFCGTNVILPWMLSASTGDDLTRVTDLTTNMLESVGLGPEHLDLRGFALVFFPIIDEGHLYLEVFDLTNCEISVIDSLHENKSTVHLVDSEEFNEKSTPYKVKHVFVDYLRIRKHPKVAEIEGAKIVRVQVEHETKSVAVDNGVYVMRHMECFMGKDTVFNCGISSNPKKRKFQVNILRKK